MRTLCFALPQNCTTRKRVHLDAWRNRSTLLHAHVPSADGANGRQQFCRVRAGGQRHGRSVGNIGDAVQLDHGRAVVGVQAGVVALRAVAKGRHRAGHRRVHGPDHNRQHPRPGVVHRGPDHPAAEQLFHRVAGRHGHVDR